MIAEYYHHKKCGAPLKIFMIISPLIQKPRFFSFGYIHTHTHTCIFFSFFRAPWFFFKAALLRLQHFFSSDTMAPETLSMFSKEHNTKLSTSVNKTDLRQCRPCELLEDSSSHKLLALLLEAYRVFIPRYITKGDPFLPLSRSAGISWSYKLL